MAATVDAVSSDSSVAGVTAQTFSHTCSGTDRYLVVSVWFNYGVSTTVTGITYNGVAMTQQLTDLNTSSNRKMYMFDLINPATGANNIVVSFSSASLPSSTGISFNGANQTTPVTSSVINHSTAVGLYTVSLTGGANDLIVISGGTSGGDPATPASGQTNQVTSNSVGTTQSINTSVIAATGSSQAVGATSASNQFKVVGAISVAPSASSAASSNFLMMM